MMCQADESCGRRGVACPACRSDNRHASTRLTSGGEMGQGQGNGAGCLAPPARFPAPAPRFRDGGIRTRTSASCARTVPPSSGHGMVVRRRRALAAVSHRSLRYVTRWRAANAHARREEWESARGRTGTSRSQSITLLPSARAPVNDRAHRRAVGEGPSRALPSRAAATANCKLPLRAGWNPAGLEPATPRSEVDKPPSSARVVAHAGEVVSEAGALPTELRVHPYRRRDSNARPPRS